MAKTTCKKFGRRIMRKGPVAPPGLAGVSVMTVTSNFLEVLAELSSLERPSARRKTALSAPPIFGKNECEKIANRTIGFPHQCFADLDVAVPVCFVSCRTPKHVENNDDWSNNKTNEKCQNDSQHCSRAAVEQNGRR